MNPKDIGLTLTGLNNQSLDQASAPLDRRECTVKGVD